MIVAANESYGYGDSEKCSPEMVSSSSEAGYHFELAVSQSSRDDWCQVVNTTSNACGLGHGPFESCIHEEENLRSPGITKVG